MPRSVSSIWMNESHQTGWRDPGSCADLDAWRNFRFPGTGFANQPLFQTVEPVLKQFARALNYVGIAASRNLGKSSRQRSQTFIFRRLRRRAMPSNFPIPTSQSRRRKRRAGNQEPASVKIHHPRGGTELFVVCLRKGFSAEVRRTAGDSAVQWRRPKTCGIARFCESKFGLGG